MAPYKIERKKTQYRAVLWQDNRRSTWFATRLEALRWAFETIAQIDAAK